MPERYRATRTCQRCGDTRTVQIPRPGYLPTHCLRCSGLRNAEHLPPYTPAATATTTDPDPVAVMRLLTGEHPRPRTTREERKAAVAALPPTLSATQAAQRLGLSYRTVQRYRSELRRTTNTTTA